MGRDVNPDEALVRVRRPDGVETLLRVPGEHLQRVIDLACGEFGDKSIVLGPIPEPRKEKEAK